MLERLESRTLLSAELKPDGTLEVTGTDGKDDIRLFISDGQLVVRDDSGDAPFAASDVQAVHIQAGDGDDHVQLDPDIPFSEIEGQAGDDTLIGGNSDDLLEGGGGNDYMDGKGGADVMDGGTGFDSADYRFRTEDLVLSINDAPDDGANGGAEGDNIRSTVERIVSGSGDDMIVGSDDDNSIAAGDGIDTVLGGIGNDSIDGDGGDDWLIGEAGDDRLTGGPGQDLMEGRSGDDTFVAAQDGEKDTLLGGTGTDTANSVDLGLDVVDDVENAPSAADGEITVLRGLNELVDGKSVVDFGSVNTGESATRTFTVRNDGTGRLNLGTVQVPDGFVLLVGLAGSLAPGQSDTFTVALDSSTAGEKSGMVRIASDDANENPFTFRITAVVQNTPPPRTPEITVLQSGNVISSGQDSIGFGTVIRNSTSPQRTFTVRNDGTGTLDLGNLQVPNGFVIVDDLVGSLAPGDSDQFTLRMATESTGSFNGQVRFGNNDSDENPFTFNISGAVQDQVPQNKPEITVLSGAKSLRTGATVKFGKSTVGGSGPTRSFTLRNDGNATLNLNGIFVPRGFAVVDGLPSSLGAGQSDTFSVRLITKTAGVFKGSVRVNSNDSNENPFVLKVNGSVGRAKVARMSVLRGGSRIGNGATVNFGTVARGASSPSITFTIRNDGTAKLSVGSVRVPSGFTLTKAPARSLAAHKSTSFTIRMDSGVAGSKSGTVTVGSGATAITFNVRGTVNAPKPPPSSPDIAVFNGSTSISDGSTSAIDFGSVTAGSSTRSMSFRVTNQGRGNLSISRVSVPSGYTITDNLGSSIAPGASDTLTIRLDSSSAGTKSGSVNISSNDGDENPFNFAITGRVASSGGGGGGSVNASVDGAGTLIINGTAGNDSISVKGSGNSATVTMNGASKTFNGVKRIAVQAGEGNDTVNLSGISLPSAVDGRGGADTITGGGGADVLHGGSGNDSVVGGFGADQLFGDDGDDKLDAVDGTADTKVDGGAGNDVIKADPTDSKSGT